MTSAYASKLDGIEASANNYSLPAPTTTAIGGVKRNTGTAGQFVTGIDTDGSLLRDTPAGSGVGTVTSVSVSGSDGIEIDSGSPVTTNGTIALGVNASTLKTHIALNNVENTALSTFAGSANITTLGTIATGTVPVARISGLGTAATTSATDYAPALGPDDNYVTDAQKTVIGNTSGTNTGDNAVNSLYSGLVSNATHTGDVTGATELTIANNAVTFAKIQTISSHTLIGRHGGGTGNPQSVSVGDGIEFHGSGIRRAALTGDVTATAGSNATTIANGAVTEAKCNSSINASLNLADSSIQPGNAALTDERVPTAAGLSSKFGTNKATIVDGDKFAILDSAATDAPKHNLFSLVKSTLKTYFDTLYAAIAHSHEGTAILSTGETGGTKFLREDGDGTCSWQTIAGGGGGGGGASNIWIPASAWIPKTTSGCGVDSRETSTNDQNFDELLFDAASDELADALVILPNNYNNGTITARFFWTAASGSGGVAWGIQGRAFANDDALDTAAGTAQLVTDTLIAADDMHVTSATSAVTIGGTPAANTPIQFTVYRDVSDAADTLAVDARLLGVEILYTLAT
jgi:hypothetical protein